MASMVGLRECPYLHHSAGKRYNHLLLQAKPRFTSKLEPVLLLLILKLHTAIAQMLKMSRDLTAALLPHCPGHIQNPPYRAGFQGPVECTC